MTAPVATKVQVRKRWTLSGYGAWCVIDGDKVYPFSYVDLALSAAHRSREHRENILATSENFTLTSDPGIGGAV